MITENAEPLHALDLPQLYTKPPAAALLQALQLLAVRPRNFGGDDAPTEAASNGVTRYLTTIVSSELAWIPDEEREAIWDEASARLCERSGRAAMPSMSRSFSIPRDDDGAEVALTLHEPAITEDNYGMKTWLSSYLLARRLHVLLPTLPMLYGPEPGTVLELGAGTGLVGLSLAALVGPRVRLHLTDLAPIVPNLAYNVEKNTPVLFEHGAPIPSTGVLDWAVQKPELPPIPTEQAADLVVAADPLYSAEHPAWLAQTIARWLRRDISVDADGGACAGTKTRARVVLEMPLRSAYMPQVSELRWRLNAVRLELVAEGEESGFDDWEGPRGEALEVQCWWSVWAWRDLDGE